VVYNISTAINVARSGLIITYNKPIYFLQRLELGF